MTHCLIFKVYKSFWNFDIFIPRGIRSEPDRAADSQITKKETLGTASVPGQENDAVAKSMGLKSDIAGLRD